MPTSRRSYPTAPFKPAQAVRRKPLHPFRRAYPLLTPADLSSHRLLAKHLPTPYPNRNHEAPSAVPRRMIEAAANPCVHPPVDSRTPLVRIVGWRTLESEGAARRGVADPPRQDACPRLAADLGCRQAHGLPAVAWLTFPNLAAVVARHAKHARARRARLLEAAPNGDGLRRRRRTEDMSHARPARR